MKKLLQLLVVAGILTMFTSCVYVGRAPHHDTYDFTFKNNTDWDITDWYLKDSYGYNHSKRGSSANKVYAGEKDTLYDLDFDYYTVWFSYERRPGYFDYYHTYEFKLDTDTVYDLYRDDFYERAVLVPGTEETEPVFYLTDSDGNRIELVKEEK